MGKKKSKRRRIEELPNWESVPLDEDFISGCRDFNNLISLEVLNDYELKKEDGIIEIVSTGKRKRDDEEEEGQEEEDDNEGDSEEEKLNGKKKKRVSATSSWKVEKIEDEDSNEAEEEYGSHSDQEESDMDESGGEEEEDLEEGSGSEVSDLEIEEVPKLEVPKSSLRELAASKTLKKDSEELEDPFREEEWLKLGVPEVIIKALKDKGFSQPTPIQALTLPAAILGKKDVVGAAETGSGKTLAFAIPILNGIMNMKQRESADSPLKALILTPTRELAVQIKDHIEAISKYTKIKVIVIVGGLSAQKQERLLQSQPEIVIATPGRLWELTQEGNEHLSSLKNIRFLAVDETDRMVERGHFQELEGILGELNKEPEAMKARQNFVFSATLSFTHTPPERYKTINPKKGKEKKFRKVKKISPAEKMDEIMNMIGIRENRKIVDITSSKGTSENLIEKQISCSNKQKDYYLYYFLTQYPGRTIIFCNSINCVRRITNLFYFLNCNPLPLHSEMVQKQRLKNLERFSANDKAVLVATDVAARGLDIVDIQHVIHYQVPKTAESYIHRSGRTARAFKGGLALLLTEPAENKTLTNICRSLGRDELPPAFDINGQIFRDIRERVDMAVKLEKLEHSLRKKTADINWMAKAKKEMDLASSDEGSDEDDASAGKKKRMVDKNIKKAKQELEIHKKKLSHLLSTPLASNRKKTINTIMMAGVNNLKVTRNATSK